MNRKIITIISAVFVLIVASLVFLANCGRNQQAIQRQSSDSSQATSNFSKASSSKTSTTSSSSSSSSSSTTTSDQEETTDTLAPQTSANNATEASSAKAQLTQAEEDQTSSITAETSQNDSSEWTSIVGTWTNDLGQTLTVSSNGQAVLDGHNYQLHLNRKEANGVINAGIANTDQLVGGAAMFVVPAGQANPYNGAVSSVETIIIGQSVDAADHPYKR